MDLKCQHGSPDADLRLETACADVLYHGAITLSDQLLQQYKNSLRGSCPARQAALTRAMRQLRDQRAALTPTNRAGLAAIYLALADRATSTDAVHTTIDPLPCTCSPNPTGDGCSPCEFQAEVDEQSLAPRTSPGHD